VEGALMTVPPSPSYACYSGHLMRSTLMYLRHSAQHRSVQCAMTTMCTFTPRKLNQPCVAERSISQSIAVFSREYCCRLRRNIDCVYRANTK